MTAPIPLVEPQELRIGETWQWRRENLSPDYPAPTWTLKYALKNATDHVEITASADGAFFAVTVLPTAQTAAKPGTYRMVGWVEDAGAINRFGVYREQISLLASYANALVVDDRSHARKVLDAINAVIEGRASKDQEEYTIGHRQLKRTPLMTLYQFRQQYQAQVRAEDLAEATRQGRGGGKIVVRL